MAQTPKIDLHLPNPTDKVSLENYNANLTKIDTAVGENAENISGLTASTATHTADIADLKERMTAAETQGTSMAGTLQTATDDISGLQWQAESLQDDVTSLQTLYNSLDSAVSANVTAVSGKMNSVAIYTNGNIPIFDNSGNLVDSGKNTDNIGGSPAFLTKAEIATLWTEAGF